MSLDRLEDAGGTFDRRVEDLLDGIRELEMEGGGRMDHIFERWIRLDSLYRW